MHKTPACVLKISRTASKHKFWAVSLISFKFMSFISIMIYWRLTQDDQTISWNHHPHVEVRCPRLPPTSKLGQPPASSKDIYFVETSEQTNPNFLFMCAVESAARAHPESTIFVLMKGLTKHNGTWPKNLGISFLSCFPNIQFKPLDLDHLFSDTPLAGWYGLAQRRWEPYFLPILSDACRIAIMWKFGGIYLDTDFIILKNLNNLTNVLGTESEYLLNGAFLSFEPKHPFIELCLRDFVNDYSRWIWGHQGPILLTRNFKRWCSVRSLSDSKGCRNVTVLPEEAFYPIRWQDWRKYFKPIRVPELLKLFQDTYGAHVWNSLSHGKDRELPSETLLARLQSSYCPSTSLLRKMSSY